MERAHVEAAGELSREIEALAKLTIDQLKERWRSIYQSDPPGRSSRKLLVSAIAYRMQESAWGGLKPAVRALLERVSENPTGSRVAFARPSQKRLPVRCGSVTGGARATTSPCSTTGFCTESKITDRFRRSRAS